MSSVRMKRLLKELTDLRGGSNSKRQHLSGSDDEDIKSDSRLLPNYNQPPSHIYNSGTGKKPAELFRKDLISAMKLPDNEQLDPQEYIIITDQWKPEWERGVQVPVNPDSLPNSSYYVSNKIEGRGDFKLPKKYLKANEYGCGNEGNQDGTVSHEKVCRYDLDLLDDQWLKTLNIEREMLGLVPIEEDTVEAVMEELEMTCYTEIHKTIQTEQGLGIEFDENVICDVCRSPDSEEGNEMVFCDSCDICVHQACYGITEIPEGSWVCKPCSARTEPLCILCPNRGGAMKPIKNGGKWTHVSCALWIPEVSFGCVEKMEPITKINQIPASRWNLICSQCKEKKGACIQCSVKTCKTAYHVTCAIKDLLHMKAILLDKNQTNGGIKLRSYCEKHSEKNNKKPHDSESESDTESNRDKYSMSEEKRNTRNIRLEQIEMEFYNYVSVHDVAASLQVSKDVVEFIYQYWKLKRMANFAKPLLRPKEAERELLNQQQEDKLYKKVKMFVRLRQDLERVRNLCYMVNRREKLSRSLLKSRSEVFDKQKELLEDDSLLLSERERRGIVHANHTNHIYDMLYSSIDDKSKYRHLQSLLSTLNQHLRVDKEKRTSKSIENPYAKKYSVNRVMNRTKHLSTSSVDDSSSTILVPLDGDVKEAGNEENSFSDQLKQEPKKLSNDKDENDDRYWQLKSSRRKKNGTYIRNKVSGTTLKCLPSKDSVRKMKRSKFENRIRCEKLREVNSDIRDSMFRHQLSKKSSILSGYKIPKKSASSTTIKQKCGDEENLKEQSRSDESISKLRTSSAPCESDNSRLTRSTVSKGGLETSDVDKNSYPIRSRQVDSSKHRSS